MRRLTNEQTMERYGMTLEKWESLSAKERSLHQSMHAHLNRKECECGNPATVMRSGRRICQRCADIESHRGQRFDGNGTGETCGVRDGYDPFTVNL